LDIEKVLLENSSSVTDAADDIVGADFGTILK